MRFYLNYLQRYIYANAKFISMIGLNPDFLQRSEISSHHLLFIISEPVQVVRRKGKEFLNKQAKFCYRSFANTFFRILETIFSKALPVSVLLPSKVLP